MKKNLRSCQLLCATGLAAFFVSGCYTQIGTSKWDTDRDYSANESPQYEDTTAADNYSGGEYDDDYNWRPRYLGFDYYHPSMWVGVSFYDDPWWWRGRYGYYAYDPFYAYYDPWAYGPWWYTPYASYGGHWGNYHNVYYGDVRYRGGATRTFGNTRGGGSPRGSVNEGYRGTGVSAGTLPTGMRNGSSRGETPRVSTGRQRETLDAGRTPRNGTTGRGTDLGTRRSHERTHVDNPRTPYRPPRESTGSRGGDRTGSSGRSYTPPPSSPPPSAPASPPPSSGGNSGSGDRGNSSGGNRGGSRR